MDTKPKYRNRAHELIRLAEVLKNAGISNVETLDISLMRTIQGYATQINIEPLRPREIEYIWLKLID